MLFYKLRLLICIESKKVPWADKPKNRPRVVRRKSILSSRKEVLLLTTEQTGVITDYKLWVKMQTYCAEKEDSHLSTPNYCVCNKVALFKMKKDRRCPKACFL